jgi:hypothetical protein
LNVKERQARRTAPAAKTMRIPSGVVLACAAVIARAVIPSATMK